MHHTVTHWHGHTFHDVYFTVPVMVVSLVLVICLVPMYLRASLAAAQSQKGDATCG